MCPVLRYLSCQDSGLIPETGCWCSHLVSQRSPLYGTIWPYSRRSNFLGIDRLVYDVVFVLLPLQKSVRVEERCGLEDGLSSNTVQESKDIPVLIEYLHGYLRVDQWLEDYLRNLLRTLLRESYSSSSFCRDLRRYWSVTSDIRLNSTM
jgi:hypothetical protein